MNADEGLAALLERSEELTSWYEQSLTEADTRCKIVDVFLKDVLGWSEGAIRRELRTTDGEYQDYRLESPTNRFVLEAKRIGPSFELPPGTPLRMRREGVLVRSTALHGAIQQVVAYCKSEEVAVGVATNGLQFAVTLVYTPAGSSYDTLFFDGLSRITESFALFWGLLSPEANSEDRMRGILSAREMIRAAPQYSARVLDRLPIPDEAINRNPVDVSLAPIIRHYFSDLTGEDKRDVLKQAYVESGRQAQYGKQLDALLEDQSPRVDAPVTDITTTKKSSPELDLALGENIRESGAPEGRVLLLVGGVGSGKTTFEHRYFDFLIEDSLVDKVVPVFLDFTRTSDDMDLGSFTDEQVLASFDEDDTRSSWVEWDSLLQMYEKEIAALRRGVLAPFWNTNKDKYWELVSEEIQRRISDTQTHIGAIIRYLRLRHGKTVCVVFDNVDQLGQSFQHKAIRLAFQKCGLWKCLGILTVREETYWRFRNSPPLDAYHRHTYHISSPRIANVLAKRLDLAKKNHGSESVSLRLETGMQVSGISIGQFLEVLIDSFLGEDQRNIMMIESLAANDVRLALDMFSSFLTSGHTNTEEYIKSYISSGAYDVPFHHLLRGIALGERRHYDSAKSVIANLFTIEDDGFYSHFQKIRVLRYLEGLRQIDAVPGRGFIEVTRLFEAFRALVSDEEGLRRLLDPLLQHRLIESANGYRIEGEAADLVRVTVAGSYYLSTLLNEFSYLDLLSIDTPIKSASSFDSLLQASFPGNRLAEAIGLRISRVEVFIKYLQEEERDERRLVESSGLPENVIAPVMPGIVQAFTQQNKHIMKQAKRWGTDKPREPGRGSRQTLRRFAPVKRDHVGEDGAEGDGGAGGCAV